MRARSSSTQEGSQPQRCRMDLEGAAVVISPGGFATTPGGCRTVRSAGVVISPGGFATLRRSRPAHGALRVVINPGGFVTGALLDHRVGDVVSSSTQEVRNETSPSAGAAAPAVVINPAGFATAARFPRSPGRTGARHQPRRVRNAAWSAPTPSCPARHQPRRVRNGTVRLLSQPRASRSSSTQEGRNLMTWVRFGSCVVGRHQPRRVHNRQVTVSRNNWPGGRHQPKRVRNSAFRMMILPVIACRHQPRRVVHRSESEMAPLRAASADSRYVTLIRRPKEHARHRCPLSPLLRRQRSGTCLAPLPHQ